MRKRGIFYVGAILAMAVVLGGCDLFNNLGGRDEIPNYQNDSVARNKIELNGGISTATEMEEKSADEGDGGNGGEIRIYASGYDSVHIDPEGDVDASFEIPDYDVNADLGANGLVVNSSLEVEVLDNHAEAEVGEVYLLYNDCTLYKRLSEAVDDYVEITGIRVNDGKTLTLNPNDGDGTVVSLVFDNDVDIRGKVTTAPWGGVPAAEQMTRGAASINSCALQIEAGRIFIRATGSIITKGLHASDGSNMDGGQGGAIELYSNLGVFSLGKIDASGGHGDGEGDGGDAAYNYGGAVGALTPALADFEYGDGVMLFADYGVVINRGPAYLNGGDGYSGGDGEALYLYAYWHVYNTGDVQANGGEGEYGDGGDGGGFEIWAYSGGGFNSGNVAANGGVGKGGDGGSGGWFEIESGDDEEGGYWGGKLINSGNFQGNGGNGLYGGGSADEFWLESNGKEEIIQKGSVVMNGGDCTGTSGYGGDGGEIGAEKDYYGMIMYGPEADESEDIIGNNIKLTWLGKVESNGGKGPGAGHGGWFYLWNGYDEYKTGPISKATYLPDNFETNLIGFSRFELNGGQGYVDGGYGGYVNITDYFGDVLASVDIYAKGGRGLNDDGGCGGYVYLLAGAAFLDLEDEDSPIPPDLEGLDAVVGYNGIIDVSGGDGSDGVGGGGQSILMGWDGAAVKGTITANGGNGIGSYADGGNAGDFEKDIIDLDEASILIAAQNGDAYVSGNFNAKGGNGAGEGDGGNGGNIAVGAAGLLKSVADYDVRGGNAGDDTIGDGGYGGIIDLFSYGDATEHSGKARINGGSGYDAGEEGAFFIDDVLVDGMIK